MRRMLEDVLAFHQKFDVPFEAYPSFPEPDRTELRRVLHREEYYELDTALAHAVMVFKNPHCFTPEQEKRALIAVADGVVDLSYVLAGTVWEFGMAAKMEDGWSEVHAANMRKEGGGKRFDGKILKPPGWVGPDWEKVLFR